MDACPRFNDKVRCIGLLAKRNPCAPFQYCARPDEGVCPAFFSADFQRSHCAAVSTIVQWETGHETTTALPPHTASFVHHKSCARGRWRISHRVASPFVRALDKCDVQGMTNKHAAVGHVRLQVRTPAPYGACYVITSRSTRTAIKNWSSNSSAVQI